MLTATLFLTLSFLPQNVERVTIDRFGGDPLRYSQRSTMSADGRYVAFISQSKDFVDNDTNNEQDVFVRDLFLDKTTRESVTSGGGNANGGSVFMGSMSADGRYLTFSCYASNLVAKDNNGEMDVFLRDRVNKTTTLVSRTPAGASGNEDSDFSLLVTEENLVVFASSAYDLGPADPNTFWSDLYAYNYVTGSMQLIVAGSSGSYYMRPIDYAPGSRELLFHSDRAYDAADSNGEIDAYVLDIVSGQIELASSDANGGGGNARSVPEAITSDGRFVYMVSDASNFDPADNNASADLYVKDRSSGTIERVLYGHDGSLPQGEGVFGSRVTLSDDDRMMVFGSQASNLVPGDSNGQRDSFFLDRRLDRIGRVVPTWNSLQATRQVREPMISANGRWVIFHSDDPALVPRDHNGVTDIFRKAISPLHLMENPVLRVGETHPVQVWGAEDGEVVHFLWTPSNAGYGPASATIGGLHFGLKSPIRTFDTVVSSGGEALSLRRIGDFVLRRPVSLQAVVIRGAGGVHTIFSNVVLDQVE